MSAARLPVSLPALLIALLLLACKPAASETPTAAAAAAMPAPATAMAIADTAAALNPLASPKQAVHAAMRKFAAATSYHATMQMDAGAHGPIGNEIDFVAPDRFRMTLQGMGTQTIIGDTMYMDMGGHSMQVPLPAGSLGKWRDPAQLDANAATMTVQAQGRESIDGVAARKYLVHTTQPQPADVTMWIGANDLPLQIRVSGEAQGQASTTTIRYSRFNDPSLRIEPPK